MSTILLISQFGMHYKTYIHSIRRTNITDLQNQNHELKMYAMKWLLRHYTNHNKHCGDPCPGSVLQNYEEPGTGLQQYSSWFAHPNIVHLQNIVSQQVKYKEQNKNTSLAKTSTTGVGMWWSFQFGIMHKTAAHNNHIWQQWLSPLC